MSTMLANLRGEAPGIAYSSAPPDKLRFVLVHRAVRLVGRKRVDQPLDLPPVAEFEDVLGTPALFGAHRRLQGRLAAELAH